MPDEQGRAGRYLRAAFWNAWNLTGLAGAAAAAVATGDTWIAAAGLGLEAVWIAIATRSPRFRRAVDAQASTTRREHSLQAARNELGLLPAGERTAVQNVATAAAEIRTECLRNPRLGGDLVAGDLDQLDATVTEYIHLAVVAQRCETYLARTDPRRLEHERDEWQRQADAATDERVRVLALQNAEVLDRRLSMMGEIRIFAGRARSQMSLVQNTVALLRDQVLTMSTPAAVTQELASLVTSLDALREAAREVETAMAPPALTEGTGGAPLREGSQGEPAPATTPHPGARVRT
jgi:hypothetical protein